MSLALRLLAPQATYHSQPGQLRCSVAEHDYEAAERSKHDLSSTILHGLPHADTQREDIVQWVGSAKSRLKLRKVRRIVLDPNGGINSG